MSEKEAKAMIKINKELIQIFEQKIKNKISFIWNDDE